MTTSNPTKEEVLMKEVAKVTVGKASEGKEPRVSAKELEALARSLEFTEDDLRSFIEFIETPLGRESFKKTVRLEMWKTGFRPGR